MNDEHTYELETIIAELNITKPVNEIEIQDVLGKSLDKLEKWEAFYEMYAKRMGFGTRKDDVRRSNGVIIMRRVVSDGLLAQVRSMNSVGIKTANIMSHVALQSGGYEKMPCQLRDVYNRVAEKDPNFFVVYQVDDENHLANLLWADGNSRVDYVAFGDVLGFDTTYMTNEYNKPLTVLIGVNHHFNTCIFGFALLLHEKLPSYSWLLQKFLECHGDKKPNVVVTDQDAAMKQAIVEHMPDVTHRLCAWHLNTNASKKVKDLIFLKTFKDLMYNYYEEEEFEARWLDVIQTQQLTDNEWCQTTFESRQQWAETYLRGSFVVGMRTT
ncbi:hypothetical protein CsatB_007401 [Cannabis sativa]|uniref:protein FAR1-RELATED SEQUENCE 4-like n=1 Tax=Cannabis sativa TaxID=3483 RepID=UPI0029CA178B|nr:protein FAR1-RELATED SEQUENCE 4-like [Cannabis sativa]